MKRIVSAFLLLVMLAGFLGQAAPAAAADTSLQLSKTSWTIQLDATYRLTARQGTKDVTATSTWSSSDKSVATVSGGRITGKAYGTCTITARAKDGASAACAVKIVPTKVNLTSASKKSAGTVTLNWKKIPGVTGYQIYRSTSSTGTYSKVKTISGASVISFSNTVTKNKKYYYKIRAYYKTSSGVYLYGDYSAVRSIQM